MTTKKRPILFNTEMVRAVLDGRKTQTRRVIKPKVAWRGRYEGGYDLVPVAMTHPPGMWCWEHGGQYDDIGRCPYGVPGDRLWVRETWRHYGNSARYDADAGHWQSKALVIYRADDEATEVLMDDPPSYGPSDAKGWARWRPSIHMPRAMSRISLEVTGVRVERIDEITINDCIAEGINGEFPVGLPPTLACKAVAHDFRELWDSINAKRGYGWDVNPWVWVVEFKRMES